VTAAQLEARAIELFARAELTEDAEQRDILRAAACWYARRAELTRWGLSHER
jgi:hypothetical protein